jgi:predicted enzyme related to lactoylglutathione lyase
VNKEPNQINFLEFPGGSVEAVAKIKAFYSAVFGWGFKDWGDDYIDTSDSGLASGFNADPEHCPIKPLAVIYASDLVTVRAAVLAAGGVLTKETFEFPGGRRFHFTDPAGNELAVWSDK